MELQELKTEQKLFLNYELGKKVSYLNVLILSKPESVRVKISERTCPKNHKLKIIRSFALDENVCPIHNCEFIKGAILSYTELYNFYGKTLAKEDKLSIYVPADKFETKLDIYNHVDIMGFDVNVATKNKGIFYKGLFIADGDKEIRFSEEIKSNQKSMLSKEQVIDLFLSNRPPLPYPADIISKYKHALLLSQVHTGINILVIGNPGHNKTEGALQLKAMGGGTYVFVPEASEVGLIGMAIKDMDGGFHFEGGAIFDAKNKTLIVDEVDKMHTRSFLQHLNGIVANHNFSYRKANIKYEDHDFYVSFVGFGNPIGARFTTNPAHDIDNTFKGNREFLSRMHFIFALQGKSEMSEVEINALQENIDLSGASIYIRQARQIKITEKDIEPDAKREMYRLYKQHINDERFYKKLTDLVIAEAKFSMHKKVTKADVLSIESLLDAQRSLLFGHSIN